MIEKLTTKVSINTRGEAIRFAKECEQVADEFAIGFAEWFFDKNWNKNSLSSSEFKKQLEIYKQTL